MLGVEIDPEYKEQILESVRRQAEARKRRRKEKAAQAEGMLEHCQDENFAYIVGYTNWGFPYGVTWEEWEEMEASELEGLEPENTGTNSHR